MPNETPYYEIFDICGTDPDELHLLVHIEPYPGDEEAYRAAIVTLSSQGLAAETILDTWASACWQSPSGTIYVAAMDGSIRSNPGGQWIKTFLGERYTPNNVWGLGDDLIYCSAFDGNFFRQQARGWQNFNDGLTGNLGGIGGSAEDDLYILGGSGEIFHHDGKTWSEVESPTNKKLISVLSVSQGEAYFCGWNGAFFHLANGAWEDYSLDGDLNLYMLTFYHDRLFVGAYEGMFLFDGSALEPFADDIVATGVRVVGDRLFAFGDNIIQQYDGNTWTRTEMDFSTIIPTQLP